MSDKIDKAIKQRMNAPQSPSEKAGYGPSLKIANNSPDQCTNCHGTGRVITMMACMPPHIYGDCPACGGKGSNQGSPGSGQATP